MQTFTPLPFGGAVLLDTVTLAVAECDESEAKLIASLIAGDDDPEIRRMGARLHESGWLLDVLDWR